MPRERHWPTTKASLLRQIRDPQDASAWRRFVDLYMPLIYHYARRRGLQDADAQNVTQEVLSQVNRAILSFEYDPELGRFRNWLGLITKQRILRHLDRETSVVRGLGGGAGDVIGDKVAHGADGAWIEAFNAHVYQCARERVQLEFGTAEWQAFEQVWERGQKPQDVAARMRRKPDWVYQAKFQVLRRLKQEVVRLSNEGISFR